MFNIGFAELILVLLVAFLIVGPKELPKVARAIARAVKYVRRLFDEFKAETGLQETLEELKTTQDDMQKTLQEANPVKEVADAKREFEKALRESKKSAMSTENESQGQASQQ